MRILIILCIIGFLLPGCENKIEKQKIHEELDILGGKEEKPWYNGYDWEEWNEDIKLGYILGLGEGIEFSSAGIDYVKQNFFKSNKENIKIFEIYLSSHRLAGINIGQLLDGVNTVYKDQANKNIPIIDMTTLCAKRLRELITKEEFLEELETARSYYK